MSVISIIITTKNKILYKHCPFSLWDKSYLRLGMHWMKASPVCPSGQAQVAVWSLTKQMALRPQTAPEAHGSMHFLSRQALSNGQSVLSTHSGWQPTEGSPSKPSIHVHTARPPNTWQYALAAHGLGWHESLGGGTAKTHTNTRSWISSHLLLISETL